MGNGLNPIKKSDKTMEAKGTIKENGAFRVAPPKSASAAIGAKLAGWGTSLAADASKIREITEKVLDRSSFFVKLVMGK